MQNEIMKTALIAEFVEQNIQDAMDVLFSESDIGAQKKAAAEIAQFFGASANIKNALEESDTTEQEQKLISSFHNNLNLLVQKTWVEKDDITLKEQITYRLDTLCKNLTPESYNTSYAEIVPMLKDAVYLMFGAQAQKEDFTEYAFRIDPGFGVFWWYITCLPEEAPATSMEAKIKLLPGFVFMSNF